MIDRSSQTADHLDCLAVADFLALPKMVLGPVMDTQRALSLTRANAEACKLDPERIGVLGFSAGGVMGAMAAVADGERAYEKLDATDEASCQAKFALIIYPGGLVDEKHVSGLYSPGRTRFRFSRCETGICELDLGCRT